MPPAVAPDSCAVERLGLVEYGEAWALQRRLVEACREDGEARLLLLEHPHTYTLGSRGRVEHLLVPDDTLASLGAAVHRVDRGGDITYHGPGQLVGYPIIDLRRWRQAPNWYVRSLEQTASAVLLASNGAGTEVRPHWRDALDELAARSREAYRALVYEDEDFLRFFEQITPISELGRLNIGSRPPSRAGVAAGVEALRAIPWVFAWTQNRVLLPSWYGAGTALQSVR